MKSNFKENQMLSHGAYIMLFTAILTKLIGALFKIPLSQDYCLGDLGFGYFSAAYDLYTPISTLAISGFPLAISRIIASYIAQNKYAEIKEAFRCSKKILLIISIVEFVVIAIIIVPFSKLTDTTGNGIYSLIAILPTVVISSVISLYRGYFEGFSNMKPPAISNIIEALGKLILGFSFAIITLKLTHNVAFAAAAALFGISVGLFVSTLYIFKKYRKDIKGIDFENYSLKEDFDKKFLYKKIFSVIVPVGLASLAGSFVVLIDTLTVRAQLTFAMGTNSSFFSYIYRPLIEETNITKIEFLPTVLYGIKGKAFTLFNIIITLAMSLGISAVPAVAKFKAQNNKTEMINSADSSLKITTMICFPVAAGFISVGSKIMSLLYGDGVSAQIGAKMLMIYGFATVFAGVSIVLGNILQGMGAYSHVFRNIILGILLKIILNFILTEITVLNIYGCCFSTLICYIFIFTLHLITFYKNSNKLPCTSIFIKPFFAAIICGAVAYIGSNFSENKVIFLLWVLVSGIVYFVFLFVLKFFNPQDFEVLPFSQKLLNCENSQKNDVF